MRILRCDMCKQDVIPPKKWVQWNLSGTSKDPNHYEICTDCTNRLRGIIKNGGAK